MNAEDIKCSEEYRLAQMFDRSVAEMFASIGHISIPVVTGAVAMLMATYMLELTPKERMLVLSRLVDYIVAADERYHDCDLTRH
jgi:hypothetical protein